jgi:hypothetical protein
MSQDKIDRRSDGERDTEDERKGKTKMEAFKAIISSKSLKNSLKRRKKKYGFGAIKDFRYEQEQLAVEAFRDLLISEDLLPASHDDYHEFLRLRT